MNVSKILEDTIFYIPEVVEEKGIGDNKIVEVFCLSKRTENCLNRARIFTLEEITSRKLGDLKNIKNAGKKTVEEIINAVHSLGLKFRDEEES